MRRNFLLTIALAVTGVLIVVGSAGARDDVIESGSAGVDIIVPGGADLPPLAQLPQCSNLSDDDGDGATDLGDPDCAGPLDDEEAGPPPEEPDPGDTGSGGGDDPTDTLPLGGDPGTGGPGGSGGGDHPGGGGNTGGS